MFYINFLWACPPEQIVQKRTPFLTDGGGFRLTRSTITEVFEVSHLGEEELQDLLQSYPMLRELRVLSFAELRDSSFVLSLAKLLNNLPHLEVLNLRNNRKIGRNLSQLLVDLRPHVYLAELYLGQCCLTPADLTGLAEQLNNLPKLVVLSLHGNREIGGNLSQLLPGLQSHERLRKLNLERCNLTSDDLIGLAELLNDRLPKLVVLNLCGNPGIGGSPLQLLPGLQSYKHLRNLSLGECNLTSDNLPRLAELINNFPALEVLDLDGNPEIGGNFSQLLSGLQPHEYLRELNFDSYHLKSADMSKLAELLNKFSNLESLNFRYNNSGSLSKLLSGLQPHEYLRELNFRDSVFLLVDLRGLAELLNNLPNLKVLILSRSIGIGKNLSQLLLGLKPHTHLRELNFDNCRLESDDMPKLAELLNNLPNLESLNLESGLISESFLEARKSGNSGNFPRLLLGLKPHMHLKELNLGSCDFTRFDMPKLAELFKKFPNLEVLNLHSNRAIGGNLSQLLPDLEQHMYLKKLVLNNCYLKLADMLQLAELFNKFPNLEVLGLGGNPEIGGNFSNLLLSDFKPHEHLRKLDLERCNFMPADLTRLAELFKKLPALEVLGFAANPKIFRNLSQLSLGFQSYMHLKELDLNQCCLTSADLLALIRKLPQLKLLRIGMEDIAICKPCEEEFPGLKILTPYNPYDLQENSYMFAVFLLAAGFGTLYKKNIINCALEFAQPGPGDADSNPPRDLERLFMGWSASSMKKLGLI